jgi:Low affinity iron permease
MCCDCERLPDGRRTVSVAARAPVPATQMQVCHGGRTYIRTRQHQDGEKFAQLANWVAVMSGHPVVFGFAILTVVAWMVTGPFFSFSDTWQLVMNTWTNVATFLMVFLIQNSQNRIRTASH